MPSKNRSKVPIGTVLEGKFRITQEIGRGGMAAVYEAENVDIGKRVAVKLLAAELITSRVVRERFIREARATAKIRSPYICDVYDSGMYEERPFLVMELLEGESLYDMMTRVRRIDARTTLKICTHVARGLEKAHESSIVHRDLKPENIFLTKGEDEKLVAKILDFGLAKFYEPTGGDEKNVRLTREGALFGTPAYMSPEQAKGQGQVDHRADLWALGCIVYECLTGQTVWNVEQGVAMILAQIAGAPIPVPSKLRSDLPGGFDTWFARALNRDPAQRFQTAKEFADTLSQALDPSHKAPVSIAETELEPPSSPAQPEFTFDLGLESENAAVGVAGPDTDRTQRDAPRSNGAFAWLVALAAVTLAGYGVWLYVLHPPGKAGASDPEGETAAPEAETETEKKVVPAEVEPYALQIGAGQKWLAQGNQDNALRMFREGFKTGGSEVARGLSLQISAVIESPEGPCKLTGLGRPRPFTIVSAASRPTLALTDKGLVFGWVDNHDEKNKKQGYTTLLDNLLRRVAPARLVTPEAVTARYVQLVPVRDRLAMIYWEGGGPEPGVYTRMLKADGRMEEAPQRISGVSRSQFYPSLTELDDGTFVAVWAKNFRKGVDNLMARRLGTDLKPQSKIVQLTDFVPARGMESVAGKADAAVVNNQLFIVFELENKQYASIKLLKIKVDSAELGQGLAEKPDSEVSRHVGQLIEVSDEEGKHGQPRISCVEEGCFVVWDNEGAGATASFVNGETGEPIWHRDFAPKGARPGLGRRDNGETLLVWYENGRVRLTPLNRDGIGQSSVLGRVSGYQPYPAVVAGKEAGEWYVSWRGFEAGHLEAFVARTLCKSPKQ